MRRFSPLPGRHDVHSALPKVNYFNDVNALSYRHYLPPVGYAGMGIALSSRGILPPGGACAFGQGTQLALVCGWRSASQSRLRPSFVPCDSRPVRDARTTICPARPKTKVSPVYPEVARRMNITGTVKLAVVVAPNGTVKSTEAGRRASASGQRRRGRHEAMEIRARPG